MKIIFRIAYLESFSEETFSGQELIADILHSLSKGSFLDKAEYLSLNFSKKRKKITSLKWLIEESRNWKKGNFELFPSKENPDNFVINFNLGKSDLGFLIVIRNDFAINFGEEILEEWKLLLVELNKKYVDKIYFGPILAVEIYDLDYSHLHPERDHPLVKNEEIVSVFSKKFQQQNELGNKKELNRLLKADLPDWATIENKDDLIFFNWFSPKSLTNQEVLRQEMKEKEIFLANEMNAPIADGQNEFGDQEIWTEMLLPHPPLTFYDAFTQSGYKAVVVDKNGNGADEEINNLSKLVKAGKLPDETLISTVGIIVPGREQAQAVRKRAQTAGINEVFYVDNTGRWWNPFANDKKNYGK
jgi:hypothetical protein